MSTQTFSGEMFLTDYSGPEYPEPEVASGPPLGCKAEATASQQPASIGDDADQHSPSPLRLSNREKRAMRVTVQTVTGPVDYSFLHIERLLRRGDAYVTEDGRTVLGLAAPDPDAGERIFAHQHQVRRGVQFQGALPPLDRAEILWPVVPHYFGESNTDGMARAERNRAQKRG